jgi:hypothetical protein
MSNNKKFQYGGGDDGVTDDYITKTLGSAQKIEPMESSNGNFTARDGSYYAVDTGARVTYSNRCARLVVMIWAALLVVIGLALAIVGGVQQSQNLLPLCPNCKTVVVMLIAIGVVIMVFGTIGAYAAYTRNSCISLVFGITLFLLALVFSGCGVAVAVINSGTHLDTLWKDSVADDAEAICKIQSKFKCSGFSQCCYIIDSNASLPSTTVTAAASPLMMAARDAVVMDDTTTGGDTTTGAGDTTTGGDGTTTSGDATTAAPTTAAPTTAAPTTAAPTTKAPTTEAPTTTVAPDTNTSAAAVSGCTIVVKGSEAAKALGPWCVNTCLDNAPPCGPTLREDLKKILLPTLGIFFTLGVLNLLVAWAAKRMLKQDE